MKDANTTSTVRRAADHYSRQAGSLAHDSALAVAGSAASLRVLAPGAATQGGYPAADGFGLN